MGPLTGYVDGLPNLCGEEPLISEATAAGRQQPVFPNRADIGRAASTFAVALHTHTSRSSRPRTVATCARLQSSATWRG